MCGPCGRGSRLWTRDALRRFREVHQSYAPPFMSLAHASTSTAVTHEEANARSSSGSFVLVLTVGSACNAPAAAIQQRTTEQVTAFFTSGPKVGLGPDAGLYRYSAVAETWEHVATVHSMGHDLEFCETLVAALKTQPSTSNQRYSCRVLNK